jgi:hypothetical protein
MNARSVRRLIAVLAVAVLAASCGGNRDGDDDSTDPTASTVAADPNGVAREASADGVTEDAVTIGIVTGDLEKLVQIGFASDIGDVRSLYETFLVTTNASGGINGRRIDWNFQEFDLTAGVDGMDAACERLYDSTTPFLVITSAGYVDGIPCVTQEHDTPVLAAESFASSAYAGSNGNLFSIPASSQVSVTALIDLLAATGEFQGRTIGVLYGDRPGMVETVDTGLIPALERNGLSLAAKAQVTGLSSDPAAFAQFPEAIATLQGARVDSLILLHDSFLSTNFLTTAAQAGFTPKVYGTDYQHIADPTVLPFIENYQAEAAFDGMLGVTYTRTGDDTAGKTPDPIDQGCASRYEAGGGTDVPEYGTQRWAQLVQICHQVDLALRGVRAAGPNPTHDSLRAAMAELPKMHLGFGGLGSFAEGKADAADEFRVIRYDAATKTFVPVADYATAGR